MRSHQTLTAVHAVFVIATALVSPAEGSAPTTVSPGAVDRIAEIDDRCPTFSWGTAEGAIRFEIVGYRIPETANPADIDLTDAAQVLYTRVPGTATSWTPDLTGCLEPGAKYVWFVRGVPSDEYGAEGQPGDWSDGRFFAVSQLPSLAEVNDALDVLSRYLAYTGNEGAGSLAQESRAGQPWRDAAAADRQLARRSPAEKAVASAKSAIRGSLSDGTGETYGVVGVSNSPDGAGLGAVNSNGGPDLVLDGSEDLLPDTLLSESGIDRPSASDVTFSLFNSDGSGVLNLDVEGVISGVGSGLTEVDAETLDGLDSLDFMASDEDLWVDTTGDTMTGELVIDGGGVVTTGLDISGVRYGVSSYATGIGATAVIADAQNPPLWNGTAFFGIAGRYGLFVEANGYTGGDLYGVFARAVDTGTNSYAVYADGGDYGVYAFGSNSGIYAEGGTYGVRVQGSPTTTYGVYVDTDDNSGSAYGVVGYANGAGGSTHYGGYFNASGATTNRGLYASGSTQAAFMDGEVYVTRNSTTSEPHIELYEIGSGDYSRIKFRQAGSTESWDIAGSPNDTSSSGWLNFWSSAWGDVLRLRGDGYVYMGRFGSYSNTMCVSSSAGGGFLGRCSSSRRYKDNVAPLDLGLDTVMGMKPVTFEWKETGDPDLGFVAEEIAAVATILATYNERGEPESVRYRQLTAVLAKAIQQQQEIIEQLEARIGKLESETIR